MSLMASLVLVLQAQAAGALPATKHKRGPSESVNLRDVGAGAGAKANLRDGVMFRASQILRRADLLLIHNSLTHTSAVLVGMCSARPYMKCAGRCHASLRPCAVRCRAPHTLPQMGVSYCVAVAYA